MKCPHCSCEAHKHGKTDNGKQRYKCSNCQCNKRTFTDIGNEEIFIIKCPICIEEIEGFRYGRVWYVKNRIRQARYQCSVCGSVTVNWVRTEERGHS